MFIWTGKSSLSKAARAIRRAAALLAMLALIPTYVVAMRITPVEEYATLVHDSLARLGQQTCIARAGTTVHVIGRTTDLRQASTGDWWFVRLVADGPCAGHELTVAESGLRNFRATPSPCAK